MNVRPILDWLRANGITTGHVLDDSDLVVDEAAGTVTLEEVLYVDGQIARHGRESMMHLVTYPMTVPPPPGLLAAHQHTVARLRRRRDAAEAIRQETIADARPAVSALARAVRTREPLDLTGVQMPDWIRDLLDLDAARAGAGRT